MVVRGLILRVDGERQRLDGRQVEFRNLIGAAGKRRIRSAVQQRNRQQPEGGRERNHAAARDAQTNSDGARCSRKCA